MLTRLRWEPSEAVVVLLTTSEVTPRLEEGSAPLLLPRSMTYQSNSAKSCAMSPRLVPHLPRQSSC
jgi:hypothetical protein